MDLALSFTPHTAVDTGNCKNRGNLVLRHSFLCFPAYFEALHVDW